MQLSQLAGAILALFLLGGCSVFGKHTELTSAQPGPANVLERGRVVPQERDRVPQQADKGMAGQTGEASRGSSAPAGSANTNAAQGDIPARQGVPVMHLLSAAADDSHHKETIDRRLELLKKLRDEHLITDQEFQRKRKAILREL